MTVKDTNKSIDFEPLIDAVEAGRLLNLHPVTVCEFARQARIPAVKLGRVWRFRPSRLQQWLDEQETGNSY